MSVYYKNEWFGYTVSLQPSDRIKKYSYKITRHAIIPHLSISSIWLNSKIIPSLFIEKEDRLTCEWYLENEDGKQVFETKNILILVNPKKYVKLN